MLTTTETWSRDELILILDTYLKRRERSISEKNNRIKERQFYLSKPRTTGWIRQRGQLALQLFLVEVEKEYVPNASNMVSGLVELCDTINHLSLLLSPSKPSNRTLNCISKKLFELSTFDPACQKWGIQVGSATEQQLWNEFSTDTKRLQKSATAIKEAIHTASLPTSPLEDDGDGIEGRLLLSLHITRERNKTLVFKKKNLALKRHGFLACEVCDFVFSQKYGLLGDDFIECHHTIPVSTLSIEGKTHLKDLALVCSNCHRMLHRHGELLSIAELHSIIKEANSR